MTTDTIRLDLKASFLTDEVVITYTGPDEQPIDQKTLEPVGDPVTPDPVHLRIALEDWAAFVHQVQSFNPAADIARQPW